MQTAIHFQVRTWSIGIFFPRSALSVDNSQKAGRVGELIDFLASNQAGSVEGYVEAFAEHEARGWAWCPGLPGEHLEIIARIGDEEVGRALAKQFRPDLARTGKGVAGSRVPGSVHPLATSGNAD